MLDRSSPQNPKVLTASLSTGAQLFIFSIRHWHVAASSKQCIHERLMPFYQKFDVSRALPILDEMMCLLAAASFRPFSLNCPCRANLSEDETELLEVMRALQRGDRDSALSGLENFFMGPFRHTFTRIAEAYNDTLGERDLNVTGVRYLSLVAND